MTTTDTSVWRNVFNIQRGTRTAFIYIDRKAKHMMLETFRVVCEEDGEPVSIHENIDLESCRVIGEDFVLETFMWRETGEEPWHD